MKQLTSARLDILHASLAKKQQAFDQKLAEHMDDVKSANGQPLNDKRNGASTMSRWDRQDNALRSLKEGIDRTKRAIEREQDKIAGCEIVDIPDFMRAMIASGEITQWRKHPETFFVNGVDRARIVWVKDRRVISHRYLSEMPEEQFPIFQATYNKIAALIREIHARETAKAS